MKGSPNGVKTYTGRTQAEKPVYALPRKSLIYIVGHRGVEPRTSRLSDPAHETPLANDHSENPVILASRRFRDEARKAVISSPRRTQNVHRKISAGVATILAPLTLGSHEVWV